MPSPRALPAPGPAPAPELATPAPAPSPPPSPIPPLPSILDDLGAGVVDVVAPVSACMAMTVGLVRLLNPDGGNGTTIGWASAAYTEQPGDSSGTKLVGSLENAAIFVAVVTCMTFGLVLLFKHGLTRIIYAYLALSAFSVFFFLVGDLAVQVVATLGLALDWATLALGLLNFSVLGVAVLFVLPGPLAAKQGYLLATAVGTAYVFTHVPEWTTWALLGGMAVYDLYAVLTPHGPLKLLVDMAQERGEDIPALIYEGRSRAAASRPRSGDELATLGRPGGSGGGGAPFAVTMAGPSRRGGPPRPRAAPAAETVEAVEPDEAVAAVAPAATPAPRPAPPVPDTPPAEPALPDGPADVNAPLLARPGRPSAPPPPSESDDAGFGLPDAIKLGLGDFIFYSVLVGRASMYDLLAAFSAALAVLAGLGATLLLLALRRHALPALPISIALGAAFCFAARFLVEPVALPLATGGLYF